MNLPSPMPQTPAASGRLHVLQVIGNAIVGGMETWVLRLIERLPRERYRFSAVCPFESPFTERLRALDVELLILPMPEDPPWASLQILVALIESGGVDLLHAHLPKAHLLAGLAGRLSGRPVLCTVHGRQISLLDLEVHRRVGSHLSLVCRPGYFHALGLGVNPARLSCETNGVDTRLFCPRPELRAQGSALRSRLGLPPAATLVGFVGRLSPEKGPEVFVRAALLVLGAHPDTHFVVAGEGPMEAELRGLAEGLGLQQRLHFLGLQADMPALYAELDVLVSSSHSEAMPLALMEAMACGLPVVATRVGGVPDLVEPGRSGWLVAPGDFSEMAQRVADLLGDPAQRQRLGERARQRAVEHFELGDSVERVARLYTRLARPGAQAPRRLAAVDSERPSSALAGTRARGDGAGSGRR